MTAWLAADANQLLTNSLFIFVLAGSDQGTLATTLGVIAVTASTINAVGGFLITDRMLRMFRKRDDRKAPPEPSAAGSPGGEGKP